MLGRAARTLLLGTELTPDGLRDCWYTDVKKQKKKKKIFSPTCFLGKLTNGDLWNAITNTHGNPLMGVCG